MRLAAIIAAVAFTSGAAAQINDSANPPAPQNGAQVVRIPAGATGILDNPSLKMCRVVAQAMDGQAGGAFDLSRSVPAASIQAGINDGRQDPDAISISVCCRPQPVTLCAGAAGGTVTEQLAYTISGQTQTLSATCTDAWGATYTDTQTWSCGTTGAGTSADGIWAESGGDTWTCSPNSYTSPCNATCPSGVGTTTTYDSCGNPTGTNSCGISCCTTNYQKTGCSGSTATYCDEGTCNSGCYTVPGGCSLVSFTCTTSCVLGSNPDDQTAPDANGCVINYADCAFWTGSIAGGTNCTPHYDMEAWWVTGCTPAGPSSGTIPALDGETCTCSEWQ
jgi:hypothetical protein